MNDANETTVYDEIRVDLDAAYEALKRAEAADRLIGQPGQLGNAAIAINMVEGATTRAARTARDLHHSFIGRLVRS